ncbi:hypothetical protein D1007_33984 [Hordeum vulgare]|nr:hypothetical protein D1007_33984 [Hordeum vulgare]
MTGSSSSSSSHSSDTTTPLAIVKAEPQETSEHRHSRGDNLIINEDCRQPSPPYGHLRLVRPKKESVTPLVVKQEHSEMGADLKRCRDNYVRKEMERQHRGREEGGVIVLSDIDEKTLAQTVPVRSADPGQAAARTVTTAPPSTSS